MWQQSIHSGQRSAIIIKREKGQRMAIWVLFAWTYLPSLWNKTKKKKGQNRKPPQKSICALPFILLWLHLITIEKWIFDVSVLRCFQRQCLLSKFRVWWVLISFFHMKAESTRSNSLPTYKRPLFENTNCVFSLFVIYQFWFWTICYKCTTAKKGGGRSILADHM